MHLYSLTLQQTTAIQKAIYGNFSGPKAQEIVVARGKILELLRPDESNTKLQTIISQEVFGLIRNICAFRLTGANRDYIILGSDSGRIVILQYDTTNNCFEKVHQETFGKTGIRRIVPGEYLAVDPKGRAFMIGAIEKQKFVYILNRDNQGKLTISSPLDAHKSHTLTYDMVGIDVGYDNPMFACIEADYGEVEEKDSGVQTGKIEKFLTFYEMDLGLNHVVRKTQEEIPASAHQLISVFGPAEGPGGVIICCENFLIYKSISGGESKIVPYPTRIGGPEDRMIMINASVAFKQKDLMFFILQSELGDLFKLTINFSQTEVLNIFLQYFDTVPVSRSICILKNGYMFFACEFGNHQYYKIRSIGDDDKAPVITNSSMSQEQIVSFYPRALKNLQLSDELENLSAISDIKVEDLTGEQNPQIYTLCAANNRSTLRVLRHGLSVTELAVSQLPGKPTAIWTVKETITDEFHKYIVLSFNNQTLVLAISDKVVEVNDSGLELQKKTLHVNLLEDNAIIQVNPNGIRHIRRDKRINQLITEGTIVKAASNQRQLVIALSGGEIIYFELDSLGRLTEVEKINLEQEITALDIGQIPEERQRCRFLAIALADQTVRILSLDPDSCLQKLSVQALPSQAESVCLLKLNTEKGGNEDSLSQLYLHVGLQNGVLMRTAVDQVTGNLSDTRNRFLGTKPVKLLKINVQKQAAMLALSSRPWVCYNYLLKNYMAPLSYEALDNASSFNSKECKEGIVGINQNTLRIIVPEKLGDIFNQQVIPLRYSPRKMVIHPESHLIAIIESEHRSYPFAVKNQVKQQLYGDNQEALNLPENQIGSIKAKPGQWASCIRIVEPIELKTLELIELDNNEAAVSVSVVQFQNYEGEFFLVVGTVKDFYLQPKSFTQCYMHVYVFTDAAENGGKGIQFIHKTEVEDIPYSFAMLKGKLLAGVGNVLRLYDLGKKKLLKKTEYRSFQTGINTLNIIGDRIFATDLSDSFHILKYNAKDNKFFEFADDVLPRWITAAQILDYHTIVGADKFENLFVCRLPDNIDEEIDEDPLSYRFKWESGFLNGAAYKMNQICNFYVGELVSTLQKTSLVSTSNEVVLYGTSMGSIGAFYPFETKETCGVGRGQRVGGRRDVDFFIHLEMYLRIDTLPLAGRDHMAFRSFYSPVKNVIDGDLCEQFSKLSYGRQKVLSEELDRTPAEVHKKLEDIKNRIL